MKEKNESKKKKQLKKTRDIVVHIITNTCMNYLLSTSKYFSFYVFIRRILDSIIDLPRTQVRIEPFFNHFQNKNEIFIFFFLSIYHSLWILQNCTTPIVSLLAHSSPNEILNKGIILFFSFREQIKQD